MFSVQSGAVCAIILGFLIKKPWPINLWKGRSITIAQVGLGCHVAASLVKYFMNGSSQVPVKKKRDTQEKTAGNISIQGEAFSAPVEDGNRGQYVQVTLTPSADSAQAATTRIWILADVSGSMGELDIQSERGMISRIQAVQEGIWQLVQFAQKKPPGSIEFRFFKFDDNVIEGQLAPVSALQKESVQRFYSKAGMTNIKNAVQAVSNEMVKVQDSKENILLFLTDGEDHRFKQQDLTSVHRTFTEKNVKVVTVGISANHDVAVLQKLITKKEGGTLTDSTYCYVSGEAIAKDSEGYRQGKRTFGQIIDEVCAVSEEKITLQRVSITLYAGNQPIQSKEIKESDSKTSHSLGTLTLKGKTLTVQANSNGPFSFKVTGQTVGGQPFDMDVKAPEDRSRQSELVWASLCADATQTMSQVVEAYCTNINSAPNCLQALNRVLQRFDSCRNLFSNDTGGFAHLEAKLRDLKGQVQRGETITVDARAQMFAQATGAMSGIGGNKEANPLLDVGEGLEMVTADTGMAASGIGGSGARGNQTLTAIQSILGAVLQGTKRPNTGEVSSGQLVVNVRNIKRGEGHAAVQMPMGYNRLNLDKGISMHIQPHKSYADGSMPGEFVSNTKIAVFSRKYKLTFKLHLAPQAEINLPEETKKAAGLPPNGTHFQWIGPAAVDPEFEEDSPFKWNDDMPQDQIDAQRKGLDEAMKQELSTVEYNLLTIGGFIYHAGEYYLPEDPDNKTIQWDQKDRRWKSKKGKVIEEEASKRLVRDTAELRVLNPNQIFGNQVLPFGEMVTVPKSVQRTLKEWHDEAPAAYYDKITFGFLKEMGLTHFKWLNPLDPLIDQTKALVIQNARQNQKPQGEIAALNNWGNYGAYVYFSETDLSKCMMLPIASIDQATAGLQGKYFVTVLDPKGGLPTVEIEQPDCTICINGLTQPVQPFNCNSHAICHDCAKQVFQINLNATCPSCRTKAKLEGERFKVVAVKVITPLDALQQTYSKLTFNCAPVALNFNRDDWLTAVLLKTSPFLSKKVSIL